MSDKATRIIGLVIVAAVIAVLMIDPQNARWDFDDTIINELMEFVLPHRFMHEEVVSLIILALIAVIGWWKRLAIGSAVVRAGKWIYGRL